MCSCLRRSRSAKLLAFERDRQERRGKFQLENRSEDDSEEQRDDNVVANEERDG